MSDIPICLVRCRFRAPDGQPLVGSRVIALLTTAETYNGFIVPQRVEATTDSDGMATLGLWPNQLGSRASSYHVKITCGGGSSQSARITVPNVDTIDMHLIAELPPYPGKTDGQLIVDEVIAAAAPVIVAKDAAESARDDAALSAETARAKAAEASASAASAEDSSRLAIGAADRADASAISANSAAVVSQESATISEYQSSLATTAAEQTAQDKAQTALDRIATAADRLATSADVVATSSDRTLAQQAATSASASAATAVERATAAEASATAAADASRLTVGTVTTAPAGSSATATITGQPGAQVLNLTLPAGADGAQGPAGADGAQGQQGPAGADGANGANGVDGAPGPQGPMGSLLGVTTIAGTAYALSAADDGHLLYCTADTAVTITTAALPAAFSCMVIQGGAGQVSIAAGAGTTVAAFGGMVKTAGQFAALTVFAPVADTFIVSGQTT